MGPLGFFFSKGGENSLMDKVKNCFYVWNPQALQGKKKLLKRSSRAPEIPSQHLPIPVKSLRVFFWSRIISPTFFKALSFVGFFLEHIWITSQGCFEFVNSKMFPPWVMPALSAEEGWELPKMLRQAIESVLNLFRVKSLKGCPIRDPLSLGKWWIWRLIGIIIAQQQIRYGSASRSNLQKPKVCDHCLF